MCSCLLGQLSPGQLSPQSELALLIVKLYQLSGPTLLSIPFDLKWSVVSWDQCTWTLVPQSNLALQLVELY